MKPAPKCLVLSFRFFFCAHCLLVESTVHLPPFVQIHSSWLEFIQKPWVKLVLTRLHLVSLQIPPACSGSLRLTCTCPHQNRPCPKGNRTEWTLNDISSIYNLNTRVGQKALRVGWLCPLDSLSPNIDMPLLVLSLGNETGHVHEKLTVASRIPGWYPHASKVVVGHFLALL